MLAVTRAGLLGMSFALVACSSGSGAPGPADASAPDSAIADSGADTDADSAANADAPVVACTSPDDCAIHIPAGPAVFCCLGGTCVFGEAALASTCDDPGGQTIKASNYDQSCASDSDCVAVTEGDFCVPGANVCPMATISKSGLAQYQADVAKTQAAVCGAFAGCPELGTPCCRSGTCQPGVSCTAPSDTLPACADAGGTCGAFVVGCGGQGAGPPDSCAYPDEMCCLP